MTNEPVKAYHVTDADEMLVIPQRVIAMLSLAGYFGMFWHFVQERSYSHIQAYEACERTLEHFRLPGRYSSYESFRVAKSKGDSEPELFIRIF